MSEIIESMGNSAYTRNHYTKQHLRLDTLKNLPPHHFYSHSVLSLAGFYNEDRELVCYRCGLRLPYDSVNASTFREHRNYSSICAPFQPADDIIPEVEALYIQEQHEDTREIDLYPIQSVHVKEELNESVVNEMLQKDKPLIYHLLKKENDYLKQKTICSSCETDEAQYLILPCGHLGACRGCIRTLELCPLCNLCVLDGEEVKTALHKEGAKDEPGIKFVLA